MLAITFSHRVLKRKSTGSSVPYSANEMSGEGHMSHLGWLPPVSSLWLGSWRYFPLFPHPASIIGPCLFLNIVYEIDIPGFTGIYRSIIQQPKMSGSHVIKFRILEAFKKRICWEQYPMYYIKFLVGLGKHPTVKDTCSSSRVWMTIYME